MNQVLLHCTYISIAKGVQMKYFKSILVAIFAIIFLSGFWNGDSVSDQQKEIQKEKQSTLNLLYKEAPKAKDLVKKSYGYATFSNLGINLFLLSTESGKGIAHNNKTGKEIYMSMWSGGGGVGLGIKDFRAVFIFQTKETFESFINSGWEANAQADASAKSGEKGDEYAGAVTVAPGVLLFKLTKNGLALQATIQGTKYWQSEDLNKKKK